MHGNVKRAAGGGQRKAKIGRATHCSVDPTGNGLIESHDARLMLENASMEWA